MTMRRVLNNPWACDREHDEDDAPALLTMIIHMGRPLMVEIPRHGADDGGTVTLRLAMIYKRA